MIPAKIAGAGYRFIKIKMRDKTPLERGYPTEKNYAIDDPRLIQWITPIQSIYPRWNGLFGNYGVLAQPGTGLIDGDNQNIVDYALSLRGLEDAFRVQSGSGRGAHIYFTTDESRTIPLFHEGLNVGHIKGAPSGYCVGPGNVHPEGGIYRVVFDGEIPFIEFEKITEHFKDYIVKHPEPITPCLTHSDTADLELNIPVASILEPIKAYRKGNYIIGGNPYGAHVNDSNSCLQINTVKNTWKCWACHNETWGGGGPAQAIALKHGILSCCEIGAGALRGKLYAEVLTIAEREYGWKNHRDDDVDLSGLGF
jgi:hypothetical protein